MNYLKEMQTLKTRLSIPIQKAAALLKQTEGDIASAIVLYHQENLEAIMAETKCEQWEAESAYERFGHDAEKAVKYLYGTSQLFSVDGRKEAPERGMGYLINALDADMKCVSKRSVFIPMEDFDEYLLEDFRAVFPLYQPQWDRVEDHFDATARNLFEPSVCEKIIAQLRQCTFCDEKVKAFIQRVIADLEEKIPACAYIEVYGNL